MLNVDNQSKILLSMRDVTLGYNIMGNKTTEPVFCDNINLAILYAKYYLFMCTNKEKQPDISAFLKYFKYCSKFCNLYIPMLVT